MQHPVAESKVLNTTALVSPEITSTENSKKSEELQPISARIQKDLYKEVKVYTINKEMRFNDFIEQALTNFLKSVQGT